MPKLDLWQEAHKTLVLLLAAAAGVMAHAGWPLWAWMLLCVGAKWEMDRLTGSARG